MSEDRMEDKLKDMIVERLFLDIEPSDIDDTDLLMEKYDIDSVRLFEMVIGVEELFGIVVDEEDFDVSLFKDVRSISEYVRGKSAGG